MSTHRSGFVNIIGNPNVGKSTLMNAWVGEKLSIITSKAQTTRHRILGIVNGDDFQVILSDTPGIIKPAYQLQNAMMQFVSTAFEDADVLVYMVEIGEKALKDEGYFNKIANIILNYKKVLLFGPTNAKVELFNMLSEDQRFFKIKTYLKESGRLTLNQRNRFIRQHFSSPVYK